MANIVVCMPTMGSIDTRTGESLFRLRKGENKVAILTTEYSLVYMARENMVKKALENPETDYVLFIDSDIVFEPDTMLKLLKDAERGDGIYTAAYAYKDGSNGIVGRDSNGDPIILDNIKDRRLLIETKLVGLGMALISRNVLVKMSEEFAELFHPFSHSGEDYSFCMRAKECGYKAYIDLDICCGHVGKKVYEVENG